jgi:hypothetical protein
MNRCASRTACCAALLLVLLVVGPLSPASGALTATWNSPGWSSTYASSPYPGPFTIDISLGGWGGNPVTGIEIAMALCPHSPQGGPAGIVLYPDQMERTGTQWAAELPTFIWSGSSASSVATTNSGPLGAAATFAFEDSAGGGVDTSGGMVARFVGEILPWNGQAAPPNRNLQASFSAFTSGYPPRLLTTTGYGYVPCSSWPGFLSAPPVDMRFAMNGLEQYDNQYSGQTPYEAATVERGQSATIPVSLGNFRWEGMDMAVESLVIGGDAHAFQLLVPAGADLTLGPLEYVSGLEIIFNPDGDLPPGLYNASMWGALAEYPEDERYFHTHFTGTVVPEPATAALLSAALAAQMARRRRK